MVVAAAVAFWQGHRQGEMDARAMVVSGAQTHWTRPPFTPEKVGATDILPQKFGLCIDAATGCRLPEPSAITSANNGVLVINPAPTSFTFGNSRNEAIITVKRDGTVERGPGFTTTDEASLEFWDAIRRAQGFHMEVAK